MKRNNKGFTLIELLAVIVILAVIALIATPIIMGVINNAKQGANKDSAYGYVKTLETAIAQKLVDDTSYSIPASCVISADGKSCGAISVSFKGTNPTGGTITFDQTKGIATTGSTIEFGTEVWTFGANGKLNDTPTKKS